jgi:hypothetical protein
VLGNSLIFDNGTNVGIGNTNTSYTLDVSGTLRNTGNSILASTSGLVGIGTTVTSLIDTNFGTLEINGTSGSGIKLDVNGGTTGYIYSASGLMNIYYTTGYFSISSSGNTERMRITSAGAVGIGTSSPNDLLHINGSGIIKMQIQGSTEAQLRLNSGYGQISNVSGDLYYTIESASGSQIFRTGSSTERMRITSGGIFMVGTTTVLGGGGGEATNGLNINGGGLIVNNSTSDYNAYFAKRSGYSFGGLIAFYVAGSQVGSISTNGTTVTFSGNALSDERFKENIKPIENALDSINKIEFKTFNYKENKQNSAGVTAQQLQTIESLSKFVINGIDEESYKAFDYNAIIGYLGKAVQELSKQNEELSNRLIKLESK